MLKPPERFAGMEVVASVKVADDPTEIPNKYIIMTDGGGKAFNTHQIAFNGIEWVGTNGHYDMPWSRALDDMVARAKACLRP